MVQFTGTAWNNGKYHPTGAGYGIKLSVIERDRYFKKDWRTIDLFVPGSDKPCSVNVDKPSFWSECRELISKDIGAWLIREGKGKWLRENPPSIKLISLSERSFQVQPGWTESKTQSSKE